ncbi:c-type cytochrome [Lichenicoccus sp.]|uniref:c-type cytochrome n=1 Tax=Lichenicoccus sp. TaxID=2781899 RepID=UPI003D12096F
MLAVPLLAVGGCKREDMAVQDKSRTWSVSHLLPHGRVVQPPVPGTVSPDDNHPPAPQPAVIDAALLARGGQRYAIYCTPCHGRDGIGDGMIVRRGFPHPPDLHAAALRRMPAAGLYDVIDRGYGVMYGYGDRIGPADRWAVIAYLRALQRSGDVPASALTADDREKLDQAGPGREPSR